MIDIPAIKARLSDPRDVARLLGLRVMGPQRRGVMVACPIHGNKSGSMSLRNDGGKVRAHCFGCGFHGDVIDLLGAVEGDPRRGLARAADLAGGAAPMARVEVVQDERLPAETYHELAERILEAGRLDRRPWVREVEAYLAERRLLELARADGWACLPGLNWLLQIAEEVCDGIEYSGSVRQGASRRGSMQGLQHAGDKQRICKNESLEAQQEMSQRSREGSDETARLTPHTLLIRAKLAQHNKQGEFVPTWGRWRLVIPWRGPDGRISALQRRRTWKHVPRDENDPEPAKYVLPWLPDWPYGSERIGGGCGQACFSKRARLLAMGRIPESDAVVVGSRENSKKETRQGPRNTKRVGLSGGNAGLGSTRIAIVEGAVDTLAMRAMHPGFVVLGIPGINNWRSSWAGLVAATVQDFRTVRFALDRGKPDPHGVVPEDRACARIALDVAVAMCNGLATTARLRGSTSGSSAGHVSADFTFPFTDATLDWLLSRYRRGKTLFCVLCGAPEPWLCRKCGRRRAPVGMDWGEVWRGQPMP